MIFFCVYDSLTGVPFSFGSVLSDEMSDSFSVKELSEVETQMIIDGSGVWDSDLCEVVAVPMSEDVSQETSI